MNDSTRIPALVRWLVIVPVVCTLVGCVEAAFVGYNWLSGGSLNTLMAPDQGRGVRSWTLHHEMRPGYSDSAAQLNSFALRSPEVAVPKPPGTVRILLLGDSFTFGFEADQKVVFARRMEERLRPTAGGTLEVVNAGVLSYCPLLEYLQYKHRLHILEPDLVVLNFDMSDVQDHLEYPRDLVRSSTGEPLFVTEPSLGRPAGMLPGLLSFQWVAAKARAAKRRFQSATENSPFARDLDRYAWAVDGGERWEKEALGAMAPIADLQRLLEREGIPLVLATYPQPWQVSADATPAGTIRSQYGVGARSVHLNDRPFRMLAAFAAQHHIPFVNATEAFRQDPEPAGLFLQTDFHFTTRGHEVYGDVLAGYLVAQKILPSALR